MAQKITIQSTVTVAPEQVSCDLAGEAAILDLKSGVYYGLDAVGARIWELIQEPKQVSQVLETLLEEYDVEPAVCERDLLQLLQELADKALVQVNGAGINMQTNETGR